MSLDKKTDSVKVYPLKVTLRDVTPLIWRRLLVRSDTTIAQMHAILQTVMGWEDLHLHQFLVYGKSYGVYRLGGLSFDDNPHLVRLADFKFRAGERFSYEYDFGDRWWHDIRLERIVPFDPKRRYPVCVAGEGNCPPEDCGGPPGYESYLDDYYSLEDLWQAEDDMVLVAQRLLDVMQGGPRPTNEDVEFMDALERMWLHLEAAPAPFSRSEVNQALHQLMEERSCTSDSS